MKFFAGSITLFTMLGLAWSTVLVDHSTWNLFVSVIWSAYMVLLAVAAGAMVIAMLITLAGRESLIAKLKINDEKVDTLQNEKKSFDSVYAPVRILLTIMYASFVIGTCVYLQWEVTLVVYTLSMIALHISMLVSRQTVKQILEEAGYLEEEKEIDSI